MNNLTISTCAMHMLQIITTRDVRLYHLNLLNLSRLNLQCLNVFVFRYIWRGEADMCADGV